MKPPRESQLDKQAKSLIRYFKDRQKRGGGGDARRDWLFGPAMIAPGSYDMEGQLDRVIRHAKDIGAGDGFELVYVYDRAPVWTCEPSQWVRDVAVQMEAVRDKSAWERLARTCADGLLVGLATATAANMAALESTLYQRSPRDVEPIGDPCLARIDKIPGMAN